MAGIKQRNILPGIDFNYTEGIKVLAGEDIGAGDIVYASGFLNDYIKVSKARADQAATYQASRLLVAKHRISSGEYGVVLPWQMVAMTTTGAAIGDKVYLSDTPGALSLTAGTTEVVVGSVVGVGTPTSNPQGRALVAPESGVSASTSSGLDAELDTHTFTRTSTSVITLTPSGIDGKSRIAVSDGTDLTIVTLSSALTCDITVAGAGGLDTGSEAASTGYECRLITKAAGADPALLFTAASGSTTNATATLPATYTLQSEIIFFVFNNSSSDIVDFIHKGRHVDYTGSDSIGGDGGLVWLSYTNTTYNERDLTQYIPVNAKSWATRGAAGAAGGYISFSYTDDASHSGVAAVIGGVGASSQTIYAAPGEILAVPTTNYGVGIWTLGSLTTHGFRLAGYTL